MGLLSRKKPDKEKKPTRIKRPRKKKELTETEQLSITNTVQKLREDVRREYDIADRDLVERLHNHIMEFIAAEKPAPAPATVYFALEMVKFQVLNHANPEVLQPQQVPDMVPTKIIQGKGPPTEPPGRRTGSSAT